MSKYVKGITNLFAITLGLVLPTFLIQYPVEARRLRDVTLIRISEDICLYAEADPDASVKAFSRWIIKNIYYGYRGDVEDINTLLALLKKRCPLDNVQNTIYYFSTEQSVEGFIQDIRIPSKIESLCEEAKKTSLNEAQQFQELVSDARSSLGISNAEIPDFYNQLEENCEEAELLLAKASEEDRKKANERLKEYGYQNGMTYGEFREVLIKRGWQPINENSSFREYSEIACGSRLCGASFISNQNRLEVRVEMIQNENYTRIEKIIPTDLSITSK